MTALLIPAILSAAMSRQVIRQITLASASPRRAQLLSEAGYDIRIMPPSIDEPEARSPGIRPPQLAEALSYFKARAVAEHLQDGLILAGDTVACLDGQIFGKPSDRDDARRILRSITGTTHEVVTGVTLLDARSKRRMICHDVTGVVMRRMSDEELGAYLDTNAWAGKAGAYGIQDHGDAFVTRIEGSFTNVVGMPMELVARMLASWR